MRLNRTIAVVIVGGAGLFLLFSFGGFGMTPSKPPPPRQMDQTLFIALDGIPFSMVQELSREGKLGSFQPPSRIISAFPSTTTTGFTGLFRPLGAYPAPGYDARFYSYPLNEVRGNLLEAYDFEAADFNRFFSYNRNTGFRQVVMYTLPGFALRRDLKKIRQMLWESPEKDALFFYIGSTDGTGHLDGKKKTLDLFLEVLKEAEGLQALYQQHFGRKLRLVLFSDHGFHWAPLKKIDVGDLAKRLEKKGLVLQEKMNGLENVIAITWGNISGGDLYASEEKTPEVVGILHEMPGVDLVAYRKNGKILLSASRNPLALAEIAFDEKGEHFSYQPLQGDPLEYQEILDALKKEKKLNAAGFASEEDWFEKTREHPYPDALYRLWDAFHGLVQNPATILLSTREDYEFGDNLTRWGAALRGGMIGTHGALALDSCSAFIMTDDPNVSLSPVLRYDQALVPFKPFMTAFLKTQQEKALLPRTGTLAH